MSSEVGQTDLGFAWPCAEAWRFKCKFFPSKVGGLPSFLTLNPILGMDQLRCKLCQSPMRFVLQLYAPVDSQPEAFHRTLFLFACGASPRCASEVAVFRCQLPRHNQFYSHDPPDYECDEEDYDPSPAHFRVKTCLVCGIHAPMQCARCRSANYCSQLHQRLHWREAHRRECSGSDHSDCLFRSVRFPEFELVIGGDEDEEEEPSCPGDERQEMEKYRQYLAQHRPTLQDEKLDSYLDSSEMEEEQKVFDTFKQRSKRGEVIRYRVDWHCTDCPPDILFVSRERQVHEKDVPSCENCGSKRRFEFQVMPQLLNRILGAGRDGQEDHLDWGTLLVFCCAQSCAARSPPEGQPPQPYLAEFVVAQSVA